MNKHIVRYDKYCSSCLYFSKKENDDPCEECLNNPVNIDTRCPVNYKEDKNAKSKSRTKATNTR